MSIITRVPSAAAASSTRWEFSRQISSETSRPSWVSFTEMFASDKPSSSMRLRART
jgi:hypothetical protein